MIDSASLLERSADLCGNAATLPTCADLPTCSAGLPTCTAIDKTPITRRKSIRIDQFHLKFIDCEDLFGFFDL